MVERQLGGGETHELRMAFPSSSYVRLLVSQAGVDVALRVIDPAGVTVAVADGPGGCREPERLSVLTPAEGELRLVVTAHDPAAKPGRYEIEIEQARAARPSDPERILAEASFAAAKQWKAVEEEPAWRKAMEHLEASLPHWRAVGDPAREAETLNQLGALHRRLGGIAEALALYERALVLAVESGDRLVEAESRNNLGVVFQRRGEFKKAEQSFSDALSLWQSLGDDELASAALYNLGSLYLSLGDLDTAIDKLTQSRVLKKAAGNTGGEALVLAALGEAYRDKGDVNRAIEALQEALGLSRAAGDRVAEARVLQTRGSIHLRLGELQEALEFYTQALTLYRQVGERGAQGQLLANLGVASLYLGDFDKALEYYNQALAIHRELGDPAWEAFTLRDLGWVYDLKGEPRTALQLYSQALQVSAPLKSPAIRAAALHGMGRAHLAIDEPRQAVTELQEALASYKETSNALGEIYLLLELGRAWRMLSDDDRAAALFHQALDLCRLRQTLIAEATAQSALARLERDRGHLTAAAAAIEEALRIIESIRPKVASQRQRVTFFASRREYYEFYVDLLMRMHEREPDRGHLAAALAASERARARGLLDLLAEGRIDVRKGISPELRQREIALAERISWLQSQILDDLAGRSRGPSQAASLEAELGRTQEEREQLEWQIQREHPHYAAVSHPERLKAESIQQLLDERTALLEYSVGNEASFLFVVTHDTVAAYRLPPREELGRWVDSMRQSLKEPGYGLFGRYVQAAHRLYELLVAPAADLLADKPRLMISPDGPLLLLSFEALLTARPEGKGRFAELPYLIRDKSLSYVPSASVLAELEQARSTAGEPAAGISFVGFGDPDYTRPAGEPDATRAAETEAGPVERAFERAGLAAPRRLAASRREIEEIARLYPVGQAEVHLGSDASEENVKYSKTLRTAQRIHFAVHGFVNESQPELSGLVLSLGGDRENGLLQVYEIFNLELHADLVVLSACDTALGQNVNGEGLIGVTRAFLYAGAASVVVSLWQVADASTAELMARFYRHLNETRDATEALRLAKLELIREGLDHPYYWAPFILIGRSDQL